MQANFSKDIIIFNNKCKDFQKFINFTILAQKSFLIILIYLNQNLCSEIYKINSYLLMKGNNNYKKLK